MTHAELAAFSPQVFFHLAATFERSAESYEFWIENFHHNVRLSHHLMTIAKDLASLTRVVFASSYLIYDQSLYQFDQPQSSAVSLAESDPVRPRNLTGMAKFAHEAELSFLRGFRSETFTSVCARIFRGYGRHSRDVISRWIRTLLAGDAISVYRPEGRFDYIYAADTAEGLIRLSEADTVEPTINLGTGRARCVQEVVDILKVHFPAMEAVEVDSRIPFEASQADTSLLQKTTGWLPEYDLERAIQEIVAHESSSRAVCATRLVRPAKNILVTSASKKAGLVRAVQAAARKISPDAKVISGDMDPGALTRHIADDFWHMPPITDTSIEALLDGCASRGIGAIVPTRDGELKFWARLRDAFAAVGIDIFVSPLESVDTCLDKLAFANFGRDKGLPFIPTSLDVDELREGPYVVKERYGAGSHLIGLNLDREAALAHAAAMENPVFQPFVRGREISIDAWMDSHHKVKGLVMRNRNLVQNGESQITTTFRNPNYESIFTNLLNAMNLSGPAVLQVIIDEHSDLHVVECNSRFGGASTASIVVGLDVFYWSLLERDGADLNSYPFLRMDGEVRQIRLPTDIYVYGPDF